MWNKDEMKGKAEPIKGRAKEAAGDVVDDEQLRDEGAVDEMKGRVQEGIGKGRRAAGNAVNDLGDRIKK